MMGMGGGGMGMGGGGGLGLGGPGGMWNQRPGGGGGQRLNRDEIDGQAYNPEITKRALQYVIPYKLEAFLGISCQLTQSMCDVAGPILIKTAIDSDIVKRNINGLAFTLLIALCVYFVNWMATWQQQLITTRTGQKILRTLRGQMFRHLQRLPLGYYDKVPSGVFVSRVINDVQTLNDLLTNGILTLLDNMLSLTTTIAAMLLLSWKLALVTLAVMPLMPVAMYIFTKVARKAYRNTRVKIAALTADLAESINGVKVVKAFAREEVSRDRFRELNDENRKANIKANTLTSMLQPVIEFNNALANVVVLGFGGYLIIHNQLSLGTLVAFLAYITRFFQPIRQLTQFYNQLQSATAGAERVFELLDEPVTLSEPEHPIELDRVRGEVEFRDVTFSYGREPVLQDVNFHAAPGEMIAMVGHTGAGKTTVASLLARFYDPVEGQVLLDGYDLRDLSFRTLRKAIALVLQDNFLFAGTIAENIRYGRLDATDAEVEEAAKVANAYEFIVRTANGFQTEIQEHATNLSLGQRQLIAIARAILADPDVLILDEATSNIDSHTEMLVQEALGKLLAGRTSLIIAHRLSTIRAADQVLVMDAGQVVERGRHQELLGRDGFYAKLYRQQFAEPAEPVAA
ncbi:MAG TPA: ABC transporter ATP-binding protein [Chloroflexota bacterium]|jgi:ABC-type multidrug transport system fused ATPase/permease subunit|nr:ABC transporter ATP-binding protein [Chloroflexota bacterium]